MNPLFEIDINPVIFSVGLLEIRWYGLMVVLGVIAVIGISLVEAKRKNIEQDIIWDAGLWAVIGGLIGARLIHLIDHWQVYLAHPDQILNFMGLGIWGAVMGAAIALFIYCGVKKISFWKLGDTVAPGGILGQGIGRAGCLINGCCYGHICDLPIAIVYQNADSFAPHGIPLYPTQIFHIVWDVIGFFVLWSLRKRVKAEGALFLIWMIFFAAGDLIIRFFREGDAFLFGLQQAMLIDIVLLAILIPLLIWRVTRKEGTIHGIVEATGDVKNPAD